MAIVQEMNLNMIPDSIPVIVRVDQYDTGTGRLVAHLYDGQNQYTPAEGATAIIQGTKPDKKGFSYDATISGSTVTANLTQQMSCVGGNTRCQFVVTEPSGRTGTFAFCLRVQDSALADDTDISETVLPAYIDAAEAAARKAEAAVDHYPYIDEDTLHWMAWDAENGEWYDTGVIAEGSGYTPGTGIDINGGVISVDADSTPTEDSAKPVTSGGVYAALEGKQDVLTFDDVPTDNSDNPVKSNGIYDALQGKQNSLTAGVGIGIASDVISIDADNEPKNGSSKPVTSNGIYGALQSKQDTLSAGANIQINNNTISATDTTYTDATQAAAGLMSAADKTKLDGIATGAEVNVQSDWTQSNSSSDSFIKNKPNLGTAALKNSTNVISDDNTDLAESGAVKTAIDAAISSAYKAAGSKTCAQLVSSLLVAANEGNVYNMSDAGTTTADFVEGAGHPIRIGDNVGICKVNSAYKFDLLSGFVDTSSFQTKTITGTVEGQSTVEGALSALSSNKQPKTLSSSITVDGTSQTTVEGALGAINTLAGNNKTNKQDKTLSSPINVDGANKTTVETALSAINTLAASNKTAVGKAYSTDDSASTDLADADYIPFYDSSASAKKKSLWSNIKSILKSYFDTLYGSLTTVTKIDDAFPSSATSSNKLSTASDIQDIKDYIGYESTPVVGVQVDFENKTFTRLGLAAGLHGGDDFDTFRAFGGRKRCTVADDGTINHYYGDTGYAEDGSDGQVMVYQPKFYYKRQILKKVAQTGNGKGYNIKKANYFVSDNPISGYKLHPAFKDENGNEVDYILLSAYEGSLYDVSASTYILDDAQVMDETADKFCSIAGAKPASGLTQDLTRPKIEQMCQNRGSRWHEQNVQTVSVTQLLYLIEYGDFDIQRSIGQGVTNITDQSAYNCAANTGGTASFGNKSGRSTSTTFNIGGTTSTETVDGKTSITYRGEENPCLNIWKFVMGMNIYGDGNMNGGEPYVCTDYNYAESKNTDNYVSVGFRLPNTDGWINAFGCAADETLFDWLFLTSEVGGNNVLPVGDYLWRTNNLNGFRIALLGARWHYGWSGGLFCWACNGGVGTRSRDISGRLAYIPSGS